MEPDDQTVLDLPEARHTGEVVDVEEGSTEPERVSEVDDPVHGAESDGFKNDGVEDAVPESGGVAAAGDGDHGAASESNKSEDLEETVPESDGVAAVGDGGHDNASGSINNEDVEDTSPESDGAPAVGDGDHGAASGGIDNEDLEVIHVSDLESDAVPAVGNVSHGAASGSTKNEEFSNPMETQFDFRATAANATPPSSLHRPTPRSRKQAVPMQFVGAGPGQSSGSKSPVSGASSSASVTSSREEISAMADGDQGAAPGSNEKQRKPRTPAASATPLSTRLIPTSRSRKQSAPTRTMSAGYPESSGARGASDRPPNASLSFKLPSASPSGRPDVNDDASASSSSHRPSTRGRKQPRPDHFIPGEAEERARARARRSNTVLDRFLSSLRHATPEPRPEWVRSVTAEGVRSPLQRSIEGFKIRDAVSRLGATSDPSSSARPECAMPSEAAAAPGRPDEPDGSGRIYGILAVLGVSLALSVASCVLFYIIGQRCESDASSEQHKK